MYVFFLSFFFLKIFLGSYRSTVQFPPVSYLLKNLVYHCFAIHEKVLYLIGFCHMFKIEIGRLPNLFCSIFEIMPV